MAKHRVPERPYPKFPLTAHASGQWKKRIRKTDHYFGRWHDPDHGQRWGDLQAVDPTARMWKAAIAEYENFAKARAEGKLLDARVADIPVELVAKAFLTAEHDRLTAGDIKPRTYENEREAIRRFVRGVGPNLTVRELDEERTLDRLQKYLKPMREAYAVWTYNRHVRAIRAMFRWAANPIDGVLPGPVRLLGALKFVGIRVRRREQRLAHAAAGGRRMIQVPTIRALCDAATARLRACYMLAFFAAYGQGDCAELPIHLVNFDPPPWLGLPAGWAVIHFPRPKSEIDRACVLPPVAANVIREAIRQRPKPARKEYSDLAFLTDEGMPACYDVVHKNGDDVVKKVTRVDNVKQWHRINRGRLRICDGCGIVPVIKFARGDNRLKCSSCGKRTAAMDASRFYDIRHASITLTAGCDETARLLHEGHLLPGVRPEYVEGIHVPRLLEIGERLLGHWMANQPIALIGAGGLQGGSRSSGDAPAQIPA